MPQSSSFGLKELGLVALDQSKLPQSICTHRTSSKTGPTGLWKNLQVLVLQQQQGVKIAKNRTTPLTTLHGVYANNLSLFSTVLVRS